MQLLLPLAAPNEQERTLYLCVRDGSQWRPLGSNSKFKLPKVTTTQVLNEADAEEEEYIVNDSEDHGKFGLYNEINLNFLMDIDRVQFVP